MFLHHHVKINFCTAVVGFVTLVQCGSFRTVCDPTKPAFVIMYVGGESWQQHCCSVP